MASILSQQHHGNRSCLPEINLNCLNPSGQGNLPLFNKKTTGSEEMKETEDVLASELSKLSLQERTKAMDDLHCVGSDLEETPEMIERSLEMFDKAVRDKNDPIYGLAINQNRASVEDSSFRLKFIRATLHDVPKAVDKMLHFLRNKAKYFGTDCIGRDITIADFNDEERELLFSGIWNVQADKDQNGRFVVFALSDLIGRCRGETLSRIAYFLYFTVLSSSLEVQMKGVVFIYYDTTKIGDKPKLPSLSSSAALMDMVGCVPVRYSAMHLCLKPRNENLSIYDPVMKLVCNLSAEYSRARTKLHYGSDLELQYNIRGHGINIKSCPVNSEGAIREDIVSAWLGEYLTSEESNSRTAAAQQPSESTVVGSNWLSLEDHALDFDALHHALDQDADNMFGNYNSGLLCGNSEELPPPACGKEGDQGKTSANAGQVIPTKNDILLGRGKFAQNNPGNIRFRHFVENNKEEYDQASRRRRREIITEMSKMLASKGVRFLKRVEKDKWAKSTLKETETKIAQLFREFRKQKFDAV